MPEPIPSSDFIRDMVREDVTAGRYGGKVVTRFPPEPNGSLHIGHAKAICVDFGVAAEFAGRCHLRMDDTNPTTESMDYVEAIQRDVRWLGFDWGEHMYYASDYFERFYELGEKLIRLGRAYVCDLSEDEFAQNSRGTISEPGKESPYRARSVEENLDLFRRMRNGEFQAGERVLRAKIDMASPNMKMRDPPLVRIKHAHHYRTGDTWCIYPLYDYAHCLEDSFEGVTHSLCTMEFESARELYDWVIAATEVPHVPHQTEFARLNLSYTVMSKRRLLELVEKKHVSGWDDPRLPTLAGLRRRGYTPEAIRDFCAKIGVARNLSTVDVALLESCVRDDLDSRSPRIMAVLRPLKLVIESVAEGAVESIDAPYWPEGSKPSGDETHISRALPFSRTLFIERDDFLEQPPPGYHRLAPGCSVRLRHAYVVTCTGVLKNDAGEVVEVRCAHDPASRGAPPGKRTFGTIHWVSASEALDVEVRLYDRLFSVEAPGQGEGDFTLELNPHSLEVVRAKAEPSVAHALAGDRFQFERLGYFYAEPDTRSGAPVFNRVVQLKDSWAKVANATDSSKQNAAKKERKAEKSKQPAAPKTEKAELSPEAASLRDAHGLSAEAAHVIAQERLLGEMFAEALASPGGPAAAKAVAVLLVNEVLGEARSRKLEALPFRGAALVELQQLLADGTVSSAQVKEVLLQMVATGKPPRQIVAEEGLAQVSGKDALVPLVEEVLAESADVVLRYRAGNVNVLGALVGMVMKKSRGRANAKLVSELLKQKLDSSP
ncbi:MAG TPA: glutamine--tRNA ligase/YqeY domain fusion protein [Polyangiaceae bacterium]|nr:glutamine--tRNA ligase/YqeY domain fusion protein [Polyangiaceae bacterium]